MLQSKKMNYAQIKWVLEAAVCKISWNERKNFNTSKKVPQRLDADHNAFFLPRYQF